MFFFGTFEQEFHCVLFKQDFLIVFKTAVNSCSEQFIMNLAPRRIKPYFYITRAVVLGCSVKKLKKTS